MNQRPALLVSLILAAAILGAAALLALSLRGLPNDVRFVTVKGLAEREVKADLAIWPVAFQVAANDLGELQKASDAQLDILRRFLSEAGFGPEETAVGMPRVTDNDARLDAPPNAIKSPYRFTAELTLTLRSSKVEKVRKAMETSGSLLGRGIVFSARYWETHPEFLFTRLNEIKPDMIALATRDARAAAENFARDSQSRVGKIRHANQGYFEIEDRDQNTPEIKKVRVVTTVDFLLVD